MYFVNVDGHMFIYYLYDKYFFNYLIFNKYNLLKK